MLQIQSSVQKPFVSNMCRNSWLYVLPSGRPCHPWLRHILPVGLQGNQPPMPSLTPFSERWQKKGRQEERHRRDWTLGALIAIPVAKMDKEQNNKFRLLVRSAKDRMHIRRAGAHLRSRSLQLSGCQDLGRLGPRPGEWISRPRPQSRGRCTCRLRKRPRSETFLSSLDVQGAVTVCRSVCFC